MSLLADALQPRMIRGLISLRGPATEMTLPDTLKNFPHAGYYLDFEGDQSICIDFRDSQVVMGAIASDCCRLACASFQSIAMVTNGGIHRDTIAWDMVKLYYAAFYAGHAIIRLLGESCSYFDHTHVSIITKVADSTDKTPPFQIESGAYHCIVNSAITGLKCKRVRGAVGGAHVSFWNIFGTCSQAAAKGILHGPLNATEAREVFLRLDLLNRVLRANGAVGHNWLSVIRNDLQYRQRFGVWFPAQINKRDRDFLARLANQWTRDPMKIDLQIDRVKPLNQFVSACTFLVALCRILLLRISERSTVGQRSFVNYGPLAFLRDAKLG